jgi:hypothetical protein
VEQLVNFGFYPFVEWNLVYVLSPPIRDNIMKDSFHTSISIDAQSSWSYGFDFNRGVFFDGSINGFRPMFENKTLIQFEFYFNVKIYDSDNDVVWSRN